MLRAEQTLRGSVDGILPSWLDQNPTKPALQRAGVPLYLRYVPLKRRGLFSRRQERSELKTLKPGRFQLPMGFDEYQLACSS